MAGCKYSRPLVCVKNRFSAECRTNIRLCEYSLTTLLHLGRWAAMSLLAMQAIPVMKQEVKDGKCHSICKLIPAEHAQCCSSHPCTTINKIHALRIWSLCLGMRLWTITLEKDIHILSAVLRCMRNLVLLFIYLLFQLIDIHTQTGLHRSNRVISAFSCAPADSAVVYMDSILRTLGIWP